jgi:type IV fimbrial biogenesis protein FimT
VLTIKTIRGISLVEVVIGMAIVAFLLFAAMPSFSTWIQKVQIRTAAEAIQNGLQLARTEAVRQNTAVQFVLGTGTGWTVGCVASSASCPAEIQSRPANEGSSNATVATTGGATTVTFNGLGRSAAAIDFNVANPTGGDCVADGGPMRCLRVAVSAGGQIRMCDPAVSSATDPRKC